MEKKKILASFLILTMCASIFAGCNGIRGKSKKTICETEKIAVIESGDLNTVQGKVKDVYGNAGNLYIAAKDKMHEYSAGGTFGDNAFDVIGNSIHLVNRSCKLMKMEDGTATGFYYNSELGKYISFTGLKSEGLVYAFVKPGQQIEAVRETDGKFYVETYKVNKYGAISFSSKEDLLAIVGSSAEENDEQTSIKQVIASDASELTIVFNNGKTVIYKVIAGFGTYNEVDLEKLDTIYAVSTTINKSSARKVIFSKENEKKSLFVFTETLEGKESEQKLPLPDKYKVADVKNVLVAENGLMIEFEDGSVYVNSEKSVDTLQYLEKLSELNRNGKVKKIAVYDGFAILQDDGKIYKLEY